MPSFDTHFFPYDLQAGSIVTSFLQVSNQYHDVWNGASTGFYRKETLDMLTDQYQEAGTDFAPARTNGPA